MLSAWNYHNIVHQLYFNIKCKVKKRESASRPFQFAKRIHHGNHQHKSSKGQRVRDRILHQLGGAVSEALKILELQLKEVTLARLTPRRQGIGLVVPSQGY